MELASAPVELDRSIPAAADFDKALRRGWFPVAQSPDLTTPIKAQLLDVELVVFRDESGVARVASNQCPHRGAPLSMGTVVGDAIQCPYHGWQWNGESGRCQLIPALGPDGVIPPAAKVRTYEAVERYGMVWTTLSDDPIGDVPRFAEVDAVEFATDWVSGPPWDVNCNVLAAIENFRDVAHFPFVHYKTMGVLPHEIEPLKASRDGLHTYMERFESQYEEDTSDPVWAVTRPDKVMIKYHAIAPSAVAIVMETATAGTRSIVFAVVPTSLQTSRWFMTEAMTADVPLPIDEVLALGRAITDEDVVLIEHLKPRGFHAVAEQVHCAADVYTLKYRDAFMDFVRQAAAGE
jgi:phenylpropionate dioxygenase-like ring-hydroxylating dioxygenase large terminal subunit